MEVVAQLVRARVCGSRGRGFETPHPPQKRKASSRLSDDDAFFMLLLRTCLEFHQLAASDKFYPMLRQNFSTMRLHRRKMDDSPGTKLLRVAQS
jgi:hypothetical protein